MSKNKDNDGEFYVAKHSLPGTPMTDTAFVPTVQIYIVEVYSPVECRVFITDPVKEKSDLIRRYGNVRFLAGPFKGEVEAKDKISEALSRKSLWDLTSPFFYKPPPDIVYVSSMREAKEKEEIRDAKYPMEEMLGVDAGDFTGIDF